MELYDDKLLLAPLEGSSCSLLELDCVIDWIICVCSFVDVKFRGSILMQWDSNTELIQQHFFIKILQWIILTFPES